MKPDDSLKVSIAHIFGSLPADFGAAIAAVLSGSPFGAALLAEILGSRTTLKVTDKSYNWTASQTC